MSTATAEVASSVPVADLITRLIRIFFIGGRISYRALFNWIKPSMYIPTMLGSPLFQILFFSYVGRYSGLRDDTFFVVGNAVQVCAMSAIYGATMAIANERWMGTLSPLLATPTNRLALFVGRALPYIANGVAVSIFSFGVGALLLDVDAALAALPALGAVLVASVVSCTGFGLLLGSIGLRARDVFFVANLAYYVTLLFCGVNIPIETLPGWMQTVSRVLPLTHGIEAAHRVAGGADLSAVGDLVMVEMVVALVYTAVAFGLFRFFENEGRRTASLERL